MASFSVNETLRVGDLNPWRGISGNIEAWTDDLVVSSRNGWVLVELEPIKYQLENITFDNQVKLKQTAIEMENIAPVKIDKSSGMYVIFIIIIILKHVFNQILL